MDKSTNYNGKALKTLLGARHFAQDKRHLYTRLLDALREFHKSKGAEAETGKSMAYHLILLDKGHTQQAKKELAKASSMIQGGE